MEPGSGQREVPRGVSYLRRGAALVAVLALCTVGYVSIAASSIAFSRPESDVRIATRSSNDSSLRTGARVNATEGDFGLGSGRDDASAGKRFAYMFYVTSDQYACAALQLIDGLVNRLAINTSRIDVVILHAPGVSDKYLARAREVLRARTIRVDLLRSKSRDPTWKTSLTKLRVFQDWGYDRVVFLDSDAVAMQNFDNLFELPSAPLYAPTAYWLPQPFFVSTVMVIEPSNAVFDEMLAWAQAKGPAAGYDMDILNAFFKTTAQYLPGEYTVLNSDFRQPSNAPNKLFNSTTELAANAKLVHFSCKPDGSYGKPWNWPSHKLALLESSNFDPLFGKLFVDYWEGEKKWCGQ